MNGRGRASRARSWRTEISSVAALLVASHTFLACSSDQSTPSGHDSGLTDGGGSGGTGGAVSTGGQNTGGIAAGGASAGGTGAAASGGSSAAGTGGGIGSGGTTGSGGASSGGTTASGGASSGGTTASGGTTSSGGASSGGTTSSGGSSGATEVDSGSDAGEPLDASSGGEPGSGGSSSGGSSGVSDASADAAPPSLVMVHNGCDSGVHGCPEPLVLATPANPYAVGVDSDHVYWTNDVTVGSVARAPIGGGATEIIAPGVLKPTYMAVAGGNVFWVDQEQPNGQTYAQRLMQASVTPRDGGAGMIQLASGDGSLYGISSLSSDGTNVYFWDDFNEVFYRSVGGGTGGYIFGGPYNSNIVDMVLSNGNLYWTNSGIFADNTYTSKTPGSADVNRLAVTGQQTPELIVPNLNYPLNQIAVDGAHVFYNDNAFIYRTGLYGGSVDKFVALGSSPVVDMVSDGQHLYFSDGQTVYAAPVGGGSPEAITWGWHAIQTLAVDAHHVYFADAGGYVVEASK